MNKKLWDFRVIVESLNSSAKKLMQEYESVDTKQYMRGHNEALSSILKIFDLLFPNLTESEAKE